jgi:hypothetical protein
MLASVGPCLACTSAHRLAAARCEAKIGRQPTTQCGCRSSSPILLISFPIYRVFHSF